MIAHAHACMHTHTQDYIIDQEEMPKMADIKRSLIKDLNPIIGVSASAQNKVKIGIKV